MSNFGVGLDVQVRELNNKFKMILASKGGFGIRSLKVHFRRMDENGNGKLDKEEFSRALEAFGLFPTKPQLTDLMNYYDIDKDGNITYEEFLRGLRDPLNKRRLGLVNKAFNIMDKDNSGKITVKDIKGIFNVSENEDFLEGRKTANEVLEDFLNGFDGARGNSDGVITKPEFIDYYTDLSATIPEDEYFVRMMESVWQVCEDEDSTVTKEQIEFLTKTLRHKLMSFSKKSSEEFVLRQIFREFDVNNSGDLTIDELQGMLAKLGISADRKYMQGLFRKFDANDNGVIEFEEFCSFLINDPYK